VGHFTVGKAALKNDLQFIDIKNRHSLRRLTESIHGEWCQKRNEPE
jgi:hypothetical protein